MTEVILEEHRQIWKQKPVLRAIYNDYYKRIIRECCDGNILEIGGGSGNLKEYTDNVVSTDIVATKWLDVVADAQRLPFIDDSFSNIVMVDVLHHIENPKIFFEEAKRLVKENGRIILLEPAMSPVGRLFYNYFHPEPVDFSINPLMNVVKNPDRVPFDANQAIPSLMFSKYLNDFNIQFPDLILSKKEYFSLLAYPLSGGFRKWSLIPAFAAKFLLAIENILSPMLGRLMGFRLLISIEKKSCGL